VQGLSTILSFSSSVIVVSVSRLLCDISLLSGVSDAARAGYAILLSNGTALDAVEAAVVSLEDNPIFNAGKFAFDTM
jgi:hypothetical protein